MNRVVFAGNAKAAYFLGHIPHPFCGFGERLPNIPDRIAGSANRSEIELDKAVSRRCRLDDEYKVCVFVVPFRNPTGNWSMGPICS